MRCGWPGDDPLQIAYHDREWGVPVHDDRRLFEMLTLEGAQAGLSWNTILRKRDGYGRAFAGFDPAVVAAFSEVDVDRLTADAGIVRNRAKIASVVGNARAVLEIQRTDGSLDAFLWSFLPEGRPLRNAWRSPAEVPAATPLSRELSKRLKERGFRFVGPTTVYAFMQAVGMVNDHIASCFRWEEVGG